MFLEWAIPTHEFQSLMLDMYPVHIRVRPADDEVGRCTSVKEYVSQPSSGSLAAYVIKRETHVWLGVCRAISATTTGIEAPRNVSLFPHIVSLVLAFVAHFCNTRRRKRGYERREGGETEREREGQVKCV